MNFLETVRKTFRAAIDPGIFDNQFLEVTCSQTQKFIFIDNVLRCRMCRELSEKVLIVSNLFCFKLLSFKLILHINYSLNISKVSAIYKLPMLHQISNTGRRVPKSSRIPHIFQNQWCFILVDLIFLDLNVCNFARHAHFKIHVLI